MSKPRHTRFDCIWIDDAEVLVYARHGATCMLRLACITFAIATVPSLLATMTPFGIMAAQDVTEAA